MPWKIEHKCNMSQPEPGKFGVVKMTRDGQPFTRIMCTEKYCREEFFIAGHDMFNEALEANEAYPGLPPGFVIPRSSRGN